VRLRGGAIAAACLAVLAVGASLHPAASGMGTAQQLGLPPCSIPIETGWPCPTCGMTTAVADVLHGRLGAAMLAQPAGVVLTCVLVLFAGLGIAELAVGRSMFRRLHLGRWWLAVGLAVLLLGWGVKIVAGIVSGELPIR
jgi:hypothetical protein